MCDEELTVQIEFEEIKIRVPKAVMDFIRRVYGNPIKWLEYEVVKLVRADLEALDAEQLTDVFHLGPVFKKLEDC